MRLLIPHTVRQLRVGFGGKYLKVAYTSHSRFGIFGGIAVLSSLNSLGYSWLTLLEKDSILILGVNNALLNQNGEIRETKKFPSRITNNTCYYGTQWVYGI